MPIGLFEYNKALVRLFYEYVKTYRETDIRSRTSAYTYALKFMFRCKFAVSFFRCTCSHFTRRLFKKKTRHGFQGSCAEIDLGVNQSRWSIDLDVSR